MGFLQHIIPSTDLWGGANGIFAKINRIFSFLNRQPEFDINWDTGGNTHLHRVFTIEGVNTNSCEANVLFEISHRNEDNDIGSCLIHLVFSATNIYDPNTHSVWFEAIGGLQPTVPGTPTTANCIALTRSNVGILEIFVERGKKNNKSGFAKKGKIISSSLTNCQLTLTESDIVISPQTMPNASINLLQARGLPTTYGVSYGTERIPMKNIHNRWQLVPRYPTATLQWSVLSNGVTTGDTPSVLFRTIGNIAAVNRQRQTKNGISYSDDSYHFTEVSINIPLANNASRILFFRVYASVIKVTSVAKLPMQLKAKTNSTPPFYEFLDTKEALKELADPAPDSAHKASWSGVFSLDPFNPTTVNFTVARPSTDEAFFQMTVEVFVL